MSYSHRPTLIGLSGDSLREAFGRSLVSLAEEFPQFAVFDADVAGGTGTHHFRTAYPERFYQFGIAEQNMVSAAAGFSSVGMIPIVTTFAVFFLRALEQVRLSVAYSNRNVKLVASHPGLDVGPDGASAQCLEDLACFRSIPNMAVIVPADPIEMKLATRAVLEFQGPVYMRSGRSPATNIFADDHNFVIGKGSILTDGVDATIFACGVQVSRSLESHKYLINQGISVRVVNMSTIKLLDVELIISSVVKTGCCVVTEDHSVIGGLGSAVAEVCAAHVPVPIEFVGIRDLFGESGEPLELIHQFSIDPHAIVKATKKLFQETLILV